MPPKHPQLFVTELRIPASLNTETAKSFDMGMDFWARRILSLVLIGLFVTGVVFPRGDAKQSSPGLDGVGIGTTCGSPSEECSAQFLNTTSANDVVVIIVRHVAGSIIDSSGLKFTLRIFAGGISEYYAIARTPLRMDNVTVVLQHCCALGVQVFAIHGANTRIVFDPRAEFPQIVSNCGFSIGFGPCSGSIETATHDLIIASTLLNDEGCPEASSVSEGFARVGGNGFFEVDYRIIERVQHDINFTYPREAVSIVLDAVSLSP